VPSENESFTHSERYIYIDIETDGLKPSVIWCAVCRYRGINTVCLNGDDFRSFIHSIPKAKLVFHNGIGFDLPTLRNLWGFDCGPRGVIDTLVLSRLANPSRSGGHSLRAWGDFLGFPKGDHEDWTQLTPEMLSYCERDTEVTQAVHEHLVKELEGFSDESQELEHQVQWIIQQQERNGWLLDVKRAYGLQGELKERMNELTEILQKEFPPIVTERFSEKQVDKETGKPKRLKPHVEVFNPGSRQQIAVRLEAKGAVWKERTETGRPVVDESTLAANKQIPEASLILEYMTLQKRLGQINNWLDKVDQDTHKVHGRVITNGAVTGRMTHQNPNMAQVPASKHDKQTGELLWGKAGYYGTDCRACWTVPEGRRLVGFDASGLELRMLAHYMNDQEFTDVLLQEDIHERNRVAAGLETRPQAKTFIYAFLYGAGDNKIGNITGGTAKDGAELRKRFLRNTPSLAGLRDRVADASSRGYLKGLDGRKLWVRSEHAALNTLLQAAGAIVMKKALVLLNEYATKWKLDYKFIGNIHDEVQSEVLTEHAEKFGWLAVECLKAAGVHYNLRCPLDGEYKVGLTWAETH